MIDYQGRALLRQQQDQKALANSMKDAIVSGLKQNSSSDNAETLKLVFKKEEDQSLLEAVQKLGSALSLIFTQIKKPIAIPKILNIQGKVEVTKQAPVTITNLNDLGKYFQSLEQKLTVWAQAASTAPQPKIEFPKFEIPQNSPVDLSEVTSAIQELQDALKGLKTPDNTTLQRKTNELLENLVNRPQMTPQPVTNIDVNALQGVAKTTTNTVNTTPTQLPNYGQLFNRRTIQIYNNTSTTIYWGGSDVTTGTGIPVTANSFSAPIDAGYNMIIYGIASSQATDIRVVEVSKTIAAVDVQE